MTYLSAYEGGAPRGTNPSGRLEELQQVVRDFDRRSVVLDARCTTKSKLFRPSPVVDCHSLFLGGAMIGLAELPSTSCKLEI